MKIIKVLKDYYEYDEVPFTRRLLFEFFRLKILEFLQIAPYLVTLAVWVWGAIYASSFWPGGGDRFDVFLMAWLAIGGLTLLVVLTLKGIWWLLKGFGRFISSNWYHAERNSRYRGKTLILGHGREFKIVDSPQPDRVKVYEKELGKYYTYDTNVYRIT